MPRINGYIITIKGNSVSENASVKARNPKPANLIAKTFDAVVPEDVDRLMKKYRLKWTYPWEGEQVDFKSGLVQRAYRTTNPKSRMACFLSHYELWKTCIDRNEAIVIMEHDASFFTAEELPLEDFGYSPYDVIGLNDPKYATRLPQVYHEELQKNKKAIARVPFVDEMKVPQGIAGNSCYYIEPSGAKKLLQLTEEYGCWPNDALMCRQLLPTLGATKKYYSHVQGTPSTTT